MVLANAIIIYFYVCWIIEIIQQWPYEGDIRARSKLCRISLIHIMASALLGDSVTSSCSIWSRSIDQLVIPLFEVCRFQWFHQTGSKIEFIRFGTDLVLTKTFTKLVLARWVVWHGNWSKRILSLRKCFRLGG